MAEPVSKQEEANNVFRFAPPASYPSRLDGPIFPELVPQEKVLLLK